MWLQLSGERMMSIVSGMTKKGVDDDETWYDYDGTHVNDSCTRPTNSDNKNKH